MTRTVRVGKTPKPVWLVLGLMLLSLVLVEFASCGPQPTAPTPAPPAPTPPSPGADTPASVVEALVNREREKAGLPPLAFSPRLGAAAQDYAQKMVEAGTLTHDLPPGFQVRAGSWGVPLSAAGENIAYGQPTPAAVVGSWIQSPGHKANILGHYDLTGVGVARDAKGRMWWCQAFARKAAPRSGAPEGGVEMIYRTPGPLIDPGAG
jgi:uncharacterized protein YkwD